MKKITISLLFLCCAVVLSAQILHDNGTLAGGSGLGGMVTPGISGFGGAPVSMLAPPGTTLGSGHQILNNNRVAEDFTVSSPVQIDSIRFFSYQTNSTTTSTINDLRVRIFNGAPNAGGTLVYGDTTTNRLFSTSFTGIYRVASTDTLGVARPIMSSSIRFTSPLVLNAGTYWIEWSQGGTLASGPWTIVLNRQPNPVTGNALQYLGSVWQNLVDAGSTLQMSLPFIVYGSCTFPVSSNTTNALCGSNSGTATVTPGGGSAPYSYQWSNGQTTATAQSYGAGTHSVTVTDATACRNVSSVTVAASSITITATSQTTNSACGAATGTATASPSNGTAPYVYVWSNSATGQTASGLATGNYSVLIIDVNGCQGQIDNIIVSNPNPPFITIDSVANARCYNSSTGSATVTGSGGTAPYSYLWSNGASGSSVANLPADTYNVTVIDANNCSNITTLNVFQPDSLYASTTSNVSVSCNGASDGALSISVFGGTTPYTYAWSNGASAATISNLAAGSYTVSISDANGCQLIYSQTINQPTALNAALSPTAASAAGASDGSVNNTVSGGTTPYTYAWSNGASTQNLSGIAAGTYTLTLTDANGCTVIKDVTVADGPVAVISLDKENELTLFPNPAGDFIEIRSSAAINKLCLKSLNGAEIRSIHANGNNSIQISLTELSSGLYFLTVQLENGSISNYKFVKK